MGSSPTTRTNMKSLVKTTKTCLTRLDDIEKCRALVRCVMQSNPLTEEELRQFRGVMECLHARNQLHMRPDTEYTPEEWEASII